MHLKLSGERVVKVLFQMSFYGPTFCVCQYKHSPLLFSFGMVGMEPRATIVTQATQLPAPELRSAQAPLPFLPEEHSCNFLGSAPVTTSDFSPHLPAVSAAFVSPSPRFPFYLMLLKFRRLSLWKLNQIIRQYKTLSSAKVICLRSTLENCVPAR